MVEAFWFRRFILAGADVFIVAQESIGPIN